MKRRVSLIAVVVMLVAAPLFAGGVGVGVNLSTLGPGIEVTGKLLPVLNIRGGVQGFNYSTSTSIENVRYDADFSTVSGKLLLDVHPFVMGFRITGGVIYNQMNIDLDAQPSGSYNIGGLPIPASQIGTLHGEIDIDPFAPYVAIGFGNGAKDKLLLDLGFNVELGVAFHKAPEAKLMATGPIATDPTFQLLLERERISFEDDIRNFKYYPVLQLGISYTF